MSAARDDISAGALDGQTTEGDKLDVKSRAHEKVADVKAAAQAKAQDQGARRAAALLAFGAVAAVGVVLWRRRS